MTDSNSSGAVTSRWMDFLKGCAILEIVAFHFFGDHAYRYYGLASISAGYIEFLGGAFVNLTRMGSQGIHVFFFLSGFGLMMSSNKYTSALPFYRARLKKIYPPFLVAVFVVFFIHWWIGRDVISLSYIAPMLSSILLLQNYNFEWIRAINGNWWFVGALLPMYFIFPYIKKFVSDKPVCSVILAYAVSALYKLALVGLLFSGQWAFDAGELNPFTAFFLNYFWVFVAGAAMQRTGAINSIFNLRSSQIVAICIGAALSEALGIFIGFDRIGRIFNDDLFFVAQIMMLSAVFLFFYKNDFLNRYFIVPMSILGVTSYGVYLIHHPISRSIKVGGIENIGLPFIFVAFLLYFVVVWFAGRLVEFLGKLLVKSAS